MLTFKYLLLISGLALFLAAAAVLAYDAWLCFRGRRSMGPGNATHRRKPVRWRMTLGLLSLAWAPMLIILSLMMTPLTSASRHPETGTAIRQNATAVVANEPTLQTPGPRHASSSSEGR